ncbi:hypothetical protein F2Q69_00041307 [Brassica cretica]|uniref:Uncharacterized protein n=1 Tax=Brassica cretica TaxID=69181 RepID=A0A8S9NH14_BRACR|nr:hypothetical protein F2Q69_00041307 [Brassica cretica]
MILSLAISPTHRRDAFCWSYTKNRQYTVKSGYWVATNFMREEEDIEGLQPSITKLQALAWKRVSAKLGTMQETLCRFRHMYRLLKKHKP